MEFEVKEITNKEIWENFLKECQEKTFLQSWNWGEFQRASGEKIWRFGIFEKDELVAVALLIRVKAKRGTFLFLPHGPAIKSKIKNQKSKILEVLSSKLKEIAKEGKASFIRISPIWERNEENIKIFKGLGFRNAPAHMHAEVTWELDVRPSEEEILKGMRKTTRYLIRQAEKNPDIKIVKSRNIEDLKTFDDIYRETVSRHNFVPFSMEYLQKEFKSFEGSNEIAIFL
jgi:lipid II:glycine glycyltransferase (peptidoglycan interpeptide bridge formation enzyme)